MVRCYLHRLVALALIVCDPCGPGTTWAAPPSRSVEKRKQAAYTAFELGRYGEAIRGFEAAYRVGGDARLLYNIGLSYYRRHELKGIRADLLAARARFRRFLQFVRLPARGAPDRDKVRLALRYARRFLQIIDSLLPAPGSQPASRPSSRRAAPATLPAVVARPLFTGPPQPEPARDRPATRRWPHWLLYGLAGATGAAAVVTGSLALRSDQRSDDLAARGDLLANQQADRTQDLALATDILISSAVVAAVVGLVLHLRSR